MTIDLNTILTGLLMPIALWTLKTVIAVDRKQAAEEARHNALDERIEAHGRRIDAAEARVGHMEVEVGKLQAHRQA